jgi:hypothetical protein
MRGADVTTARSPLRVLRAQADGIAATLKAVERGDKIASPFAEKVAAARAQGNLTFAVAMDDKIIKIEMPWATIRATSEVGIAEYIFDLMRDSRETPH